MDKTARNTLIALLVMIAGLSIFAFKLSQEPSPSVLVAATVVEEKHETKPITVQKENNDKPNASAVVTNNTKPDEGAYSRGVCKKVNNWLKEQKKKDDEGLMTEDEHIHFHAACELVGNLSQKIVDEFNKAKPNRTTINSIAQKIEILIELPVTAVKTDSF